MGQQNPINGGKPSARHESFAHYMKRAKITDSLPDADRMERLVTLFERLAHVARRYSENLQPGDLQQRIGRHQGVSSSPEEMVMFQEAGKRTVRMMQQCLTEMDRMPCSKVNGTSQDFAKCAQILREEKNYMRTGSAQLAGFLRAETAPVSQEPEPPSSP